jgi:hypothetical protein
MKEIAMHALKKVRNMIEAQPETAPSQTLAHLVRALESDEPFDIAHLLGQSRKDFELSIKLLKAWREDSHLVRKGKLIDLSVQVREFSRLQTSHRVH